MNTLKQYWDKFLLLFTGIAAIAFFFFRIFKAKTDTSSDKLAEDLIAVRKEELKTEKSQLIEKVEEIEKKEYSDEEIEKKYNS